MAGVSLFIVGSSKVGWLSLGTRSSRMLVHVVKSCAWLENFENRRSRSAVVESRSVSKPGLNAFRAQRKLPTLITGKFVP